MATFGSHNDHASWSGQQLFNTAPRPLAHTDLVRVAKHYTNEELHGQAQKFCTKTIKPHTFTHTLRHAYRDYALDNGQEPDRFREAFATERLRTLEARSNVPERTLAPLRK